jgi:hypothetical protein
LRSDHARHEQAEQENFPHKQLRRKWVMVAMMDGEKVEKEESIRKLEEIFPT